MKGLENIVKRTSWDILALYIFADGGGSDKQWHHNSVKDNGKTEEYRDSA